MDNKRGTAQSTLCVDDKKDKTELKAMCDWHLEKKDFFFFFWISRIQFQVGNSANSATFPRSRKITGPILYGTSYTCVSSSVFRRFQAYVPLIVLACPVACSCMIRRCRHAWYFFVFTITVTPTMLRPCNCSSFWQTCTALATGKTTETAMS